MQKTTKPGAFVGPSVKNRKIRRKSRAAAAVLSATAAFSSLAAPQPGQAQPGQVQSGQVQPGVGSGSGGLEDVMWDVLKPRYLGDGPVVADDRIVLIAPPDAENALAAPVFIDASALGDGVREIVVLADLNPLPMILRFKPEAARPVIGVRFKVQQTTPLRAVVRMADGGWRMKTVMMDAVGGGCTQPAAAYASNDWSERLGETAAAAFRVDRDGETATRLRFSVRHPMDTGLAPGIPAYFIDEMILRDGAGAVLARIEGGEPVSENPVFTVEVKRGFSEKVTLDGRDNGGATFRAVLNGGGAS